MTELEALNNAAFSANIEGLQVYQTYIHDKRKSVKRYFLNLDGQTISPSLDYENMNHFILGFNKAYKLFKQTL